MGYRTDMRELMQAADIFIFSSVLEGLPRSTMEAMASGLPCVVSRIRGNIDLILDGKNGYTCEVNNSDEYAKRISELADNENLRKSFAAYNLDLIKQYDVSVIEREMLGIYKDILHKGDKG